MAVNGILVDYEYCTGCHTCEVACKKELNLPKGQWGIRVFTDGPRKVYNSGKWELNNIPVLTSLCNLCGERVAKGKLPNCVHHCLAQVMEYGPVEELAKKMAAKGGKMTLLIP